MNSNKLISRKRKRQMQNDSDSQDELKVKNDSKKKNKNEKSKECKNSNLNNISYNEKELNNKKKKTIQTPNKISENNEKTVKTYIHKNENKKFEIIRYHEKKKNNFVKIKSDYLRPKKEIKKQKNRRNISVQMKDLKARKKLIEEDNLSFDEILPVKAVQRKYNPGVIGLLNIGATCYMNATLQCFSNIVELREKLLEKDIYQDLEKNKNINKKLSFALAEVLFNLWKNINKRFYAPEHFKQLISKMNPLFVGIAANDPKDLILFLLENMHKELNNPENNNIINNNSIVDNRIFGDVYKEFSENYIHQNKSILSDLFYGFSNSITTCGFCQTIIHNVQSFNILFFPLEEIRKFKQYNHNIVNLYDCFDYYEKQDIYSSFYCNYCKQNYQATQQSILIKSPKNIIINLNRGKGIQFNVNIVFEEYLNLQKYIYFKDSIYYYELTGVICHFGSNDMGGHFVAFCKNSNNCQWYKYNDQNVTKSSFSEVKDSGLPYVLFYSYIQI